MMSPPCIPPPNLWEYLLGKSVKVFRSAPRPALSGVIVTSWPTAIRLRAFPPQTGITVVPLTSITDIQIHPDQEADSDDR